MRAANSKDSVSLLEVDRLAGEGNARGCMAANAEIADDLPKRISLGCRGRPSKAKRQTQECRDEEMRTIHGCGLLNVERVGPCYRVGVRLLKSADARLTS